MMVRIQRNLCEQSYVPAPQPEIVRPSCLEAFFQQVIAANSVTQITADQVCAFLSFFYKAFTVTVCHTGIHNAQITLIGKPHFKQGLCLVSFPISLPALPE